MSSNYNRGGMLIKNIIIDDNVLPPVYVIKEYKNKSYLIILCLLLVIGVVAGISILNNTRLSITDNYVNLEAVDVISYYRATNLIELSIEPSSDQKECYFDIDGKDRVIGKIVEGKCILNITMDSGDVTFVNEHVLSSKSFEITDYVVDVNEKDKYYLPLNKEIELSKEIISIGEPEVNWISLSESVQIIDGKLKAKALGRTTVRTMSNGKVVHEIDVVVTDTIIEKPKKFNKKKNTYLVKNLLKKKLNY